MKSVFWTPFNLTKLIELYRKGYKGKRIAACLGNGCTKNMVIGKLWRMREAGEIT